VVTPLSGREKTGGIKEKNLQRSWGGKKKTGGSKRGHAIKKKKRGEVNLEPQKVKKKKAKNHRDVW